tara:strand:+ start:42 stop:365 length:324 start_codon:yes stop_codon:yes gene_type:complete
LSFSEQKYKSFKPVYSCKYFRILHKNSTKQSLDISISRKYFKLAVNRNKIKRRIKEIFREVSLLEVFGGHVVFCVFVPLEKLSYTQTRQEVISAKEFYLKGECVDDF